MATKVKTAEPRIEKGKILLSEVYKANGFTPRVQKLKQMVTEAGTVVAGERAKYYLEAYNNNLGAPPVKMRALAFANYLKKVPVVIWEGELIVGASTPYLRGTHPQVSAGPFHVEHILTKMKPTAGSPVQEAKLSSENLDALLAECKYWIEKAPMKAAAEAARAMCGDLLDNYAKTRMSLSPAPFIGIGAPLFTGADFEKIFRIGMKGHIEEAREHIERIKSKRPIDITEEDTEKIDFLEAVIIAMEGMICFSHRYATLAREMAAKESDPKRKKELLEIAEVCEWVPENPARNFWEALQTYWFIPVGHDIEKAAPNHYVGRFDQYLWPYYMKDINEGKMTRQEAAELLGCIFVHWSRLEPFTFNGLIGDRAHQKVAQANYIVNVTLGGIDRSGKDVSNELSCMVLQVAKQTKTHQPHISIRWHRAQAPEFLDAAIECNRDHGAGIPAWFNDRTNMDYLLDRGVSFPDTRDWAMSGCINTSYCQGFAWTYGPGPAFISHPKMLQLALNNGVDPDSGLKLGPETGDPRDMTFDQLMEAYKRQVIFYYDVWMNCFKEMEKHFDSHGELLHSPFASAFLQDCIQKGIDCSRGGTRYHLQLEGGNFVDRGLPDVTDCFIALKKVVYEDKSATMDEVLEALKADFEGYEDLRHKLMSAPKYGNDLDEPDELMAHLWSWTRDEVLGYRDRKNRRPRVWRQGAAWAQWAGEFMGALPNGRKAFTSLADSAVSPVQGCDRKGPTAVFNSVSKVDMGMMESTLLNMKFSPTLLKDKSGKQKFANLLGTYFDRGGSQVQINILNKDILLDAKAHPENYRDLVVRVAGYSAFWVELTEQVQDEIIIRTEQEF